MARYSNRVRHLREQAGLSQRELAQAAGLRPQTLSLIEQGLAREWRRHAVGLARELRVPEIELEIEAGDAVEVAREWLLLSEPKRALALAMIRAMSDKS